MVSKSRIWGARREALSASGGLQLRWQRKASGLVQVRRDPREGGRKFQISGAVNCIRWSDCTAHEWPPKYTRTCAVADITCRSASLHERSYIMCVCVFSWGTLKTHATTMMTHCSAASWASSNTYCIHFFLPKAITTIISGPDHITFPFLHHGPPQLHTLTSL